MSNHSNQFVITQMMRDKNGPPQSNYPEPFKLSTPKNSTSRVIVDDFIKKQELTNLIILEELKHGNRG